MLIFLVVTRVTAVPSEKKVVDIKSGNIYRLYSSIAQANKLISISFVLN